MQMITAATLESAPKPYNSRYRRKEGNSLRRPHVSTDQAKVPLREF